MKKRCSYVAALAFVVSCGGAVREPVGDATAARTSRHLLQPLALPEVLPAPPRESSVPLLFAVSRSFVDRAVERYLPKRLHEEKGRDIGQGVKLDLVVTRGNPSYDVRADTLELRLPIELSIAVSRQFGPIELDLGHCSPGLDARATVFTQLNDDLSVKAPLLRIALKSPCRLSGFDVSSLLEREIGKQQQHAEREIRRHVESFPSILVGQLRNFERVLVDGDPRCPRLSAIRLLQGPLSESQGVISTSLSIQGTMTETCGDVESRPIALARTQVPPRFDVAEPERVAWQALSRALDPILKNAGLGELPSQIRSVSSAAGDRIALGISGKHASGWVFLVATAQNAQLRLSAKESEDQALLEQVGELLHGFALAVDASRTEQRANALWQRSREITQTIFGAQPDASVLETFVEPVIEPAGLTLWIHRRS